MNEWRRKIQTNKYKNKNEHQQLHFRLITEQWSDVAGKLSEVSPQMLYWLSFVSTKSFQIQPEFRLGLRDYINEK